MTVRQSTAAIVDGALEATVVGSFSRLGFSARRALFQWDAEPVVDLTGRVALITGATSGIGRAAAHALAARGARLLIIGRDATKTESTRAEIVATNPHATVTPYIADLAVLDDVRACAAAVRRDESRLDVVVHNAGLLTSQLQYTADGLELTAQVHVVAPFLLTHLLLDRLQTTPGARVITVSSGGMYTQALDLGQLENPREPFDGTRAYANAKRAQVVLNEMWSRRPEAHDVRFHAMHPGWADTPGVQASLPRFRSIMRPLLRTAAQGADTIAWLAGAPEARATTGAFWLDRRRRSTAPLPWTRTDEDAARRLWEWCRVRAGIRSGTQSPSVAGGAR